MELEPISAPLELNDVYQTLRLEHFELRGVSAHIKERNLLVYDNLLSFFAKSNMLSYHT